MTIKKLKSGFHTFWCLPAKMNKPNDNFFRNIFPTYTIQQLEQYKAKLENTELELETLVNGAIISKRYKLYQLTDKELNDLGEDNYTQQRIMRRTEDAISDSSDENKRGFYTAWQELEEEEEGIRFEVSRRKFFQERTP